MPEPVKIAGPHPIGMPPTVASPPIAHAPKPTWLTLRLVLPNFR